MLNTDSTVLRQEYIVCDAEIEFFSWIFKRDRKKVCYINFVFEMDFIFLFHFQDFSAKY